MQQRNIRRSNKREWNVILISVFPGLRSSSCVFPAFIRFLSLYFSRVIAILPGIRKTFNLAPLNTSDIKSYSIVHADEWGRRLIILYGSLLGQKGNRAGSRANEIRGDVLGQTIGIAVVSGDFFSFAYSSAKH